MAGIRRTLKNLTSLRRKFNDLLAQDVGRGLSLDAGSPVSGSQNVLTEYMPDGLNPGQLRMFAYVPKALPREPALVVALHGCDQDARAYDRGTGWSTLADRYGFVVVYPEQQPTNNPKSCFSWFQPGDTARGQGEARSIHDMVKYAIAQFGIDHRRVFITGLSAGGAMTSVMLATYPEVFAGGAIIAGLPYGAARSVQEAFQAMFSDQEHAPQVLGDRVRAASSHRGPWPRISVWHGTGDRIVRPSNAEQIIAQWCNVHDLPPAHSGQTNLGSHTRRVWSDGNGNDLIEAIIVADMAHGVPLALRANPDACGVPGPFFLDAGICSTSHIAEHWGLGNPLNERAMEPAPLADRLVEKRALEVVSRTAEPADPTSTEVVAQVSRWGSDPSSVIIRAFKAAGLPTPEITGPSITPQAVIDAALKAGGLRPK